MTEESITYIIKEKIQHTEDVFTLKLKTIDQTPSLQLQSDNEINEMTVYVVDPPELIRNPVPSTSAGFVGAIVGIKSSNPQYRIQILSYENVPDSIKPLIDASIHDGIATIKFKSNPTELFNGRIKVRILAKKEVILPLTATFGADLPFDAKNEFIVPIQLLIQQ